MDETTSRARPDVPATLFFPGAVRLELDDLPLFVHTGMSEDRVAALRRRSTGDGALRP
jgi:hypothetical protein